MNSFSENPANKLQAATATALLKAYQNAERESKELDLGKKHKLVVSKNNFNVNTISLQEKDSKFTPVFVARETKEGWAIETDKLNDEQKKNAIKYFNKEKLEVPKNKEQIQTKKTCKDTEL